MSSAPQFRLNTEGRDPASISRTQAEAIAETLGDAVRHARRARGAGRSRSGREAARAAAGPIGGDAQGNQRGLFRRHCAACHGTSGDGAGPSAAVLNPYPRDFRNGVFKFTSTAGGAKPLRDDLWRTLRQGLPGTAMPSFRKLPDREIEALVEYVKYLEHPRANGVVPACKRLSTKTPCCRWRSMTCWPRACCRQPGRGTRPGGWPSFRRRRRRSTRPSGWPPRIARGDKLFHSPGSQCVKCHGPLGDGRGEQTEFYDDWNLRKKGATPEQAAAWPGGSACPSSRCVRGTLRWGSSMAAIGRSISIGGSR